MQFDPALCGQMSKPRFICCTIGGLHELELHAENLLLADNASNITSCIR